MSSMIWTSESVTEGHSDKVCDFIADSILDAYLAQHPHSRVACEVLCKGNEVVLAGEITSHSTVAYEEIVRQAVRDIGYTSVADGFSADTLHVTEWIDASPGNRAGRGSRWRW
jgi:S-adenosylmethionine synthetase